ncbi:DUF6519 domain-containing protein [Ancylobacter sp. 6x-1]|uniref:DUF6519 domain-containing protein n=1 Tax=Ancylobacter crimeensis TaxID=2579147 RepID=A0ABT0D690_9HYPH|nr:DUF6519 domain-containing protein [Ancylobacter crimeensis]MCK0195347.1 DUF6519 domain-containing protein [Ancylobacter crimeensis]
MKGDFSRVSFDAVRSVRQVTIQQGRVLSDADLGEASDAMLRRIETETIDTLGAEAAPSIGGGFGLLPPAAPGGPIRLSAGRLYVDGLQVENHSETVLPNVSGTGRRLVYLKATVDHITGVDEPKLRDPALGDADTAGRTIIRAEIGILDAGAGDTCSAPNAAFEAMAAPSGGTLTVTQSTAPVSSDPCKLTEKAGYSRLENLLYRCEVHGGTALTPGRFALDGLQVKVSRNNACELARISAVSGNRVTLDAASRDGMPVFAKGSYAELLPDGAPYDAAAFGPLTRIDDVEGDVLVLASAAGAGANGRVRLWSQDLVTLAAPYEIALDGLVFTLGGTDFRRGDYWIAPARYVLADLDPTVPTGVPLPPAGPLVVYSRLGMLTVADGVVDATSLLDCRHLFAPLASARELDFAGGDGQSIRPPTGPGAATLTDALPASLRAIIRIGLLPVAGARVRFALEGATGELSGTGAGGAVSGTSIEVLSDADGIASANWKLAADPAQPTQNVTATLLAGAPGETDTPTLRYSAQLALASGIGYQPGACSGLADQTDVQAALDKLCQEIANLTASDISYQDGACDGLSGVKTVQEALDTLCAALLKQQATDFIVPLRVVALASGRALDNNDTVKPEELMRGYSVEFNEDIATAVRGYEPIARLSVEMPYPPGYHAQAEWSTRTNVLRPPAIAFGTSLVHLSGTVRIDSRSLTWTPSKLVRRFLETAATHQFGRAPIEGEFGFDEGSTRGFITVRGDCIWNKEDNLRRRRYLNGELLRFQTPNNLFSIFPEGDPTLKKTIATLKSLTDPQRAADLNLWFYFFEPG